MYPNWASQFTVLWRKAWRETRAAFAGCFAVALVNCWLGVNRMYEAVSDGRVATSGSAFDLYDGSYRIWAILFAILGAGSLLWEKRQGGAAFTATLPVCPFHLNLIRAGVGLVQIAALAFLAPWLVNQVHQYMFPSFIVPSAPMLTVFGIAAGTIAYGIGMLVGLWITNLYIAIGVAWATTSAMAGLIAMIPSVKPHTTLAMLRHLGSHAQPPMIWLSLWTHLGIGLTLMMLAAWLAHRRSHIRIY
jgi:hypothetical protein